MNNDRKIEGDGKENRGWKKLIKLAPGYQATGKRMG